MFNVFPALLNKKCLFQNTTLTFEGLLLKLKDREKKKVKSITSLNSLL